MNEETVRIIAVDFDGTLSFGKFPEVGPPSMIMFNLLKEERRKGSKLILWTCRQGEFLDRAVEFCREIGGIEFDAVNENLPEIVEHYQTDSRKIVATEYWDDLSRQPSILKDEYLKQNWRKPI